MSKASDISNLYQRVDGNPNHYRELEEARQTESSRERWPMMSAIRPEELGVRPVRDDMLPATHAPAPTGLEPAPEHDPAQPWQAFASVASVAPPPSVAPSVAAPVASDPTFFIGSEPTFAVPAQIVPAAATITAPVPAPAPLMQAPATPFAPGAVPVVPAAPMVPPPAPAPVYTQAAPVVAPAAPVAASPVATAPVAATQPAFSTGLKGLFARLDRVQSDKESPKPPARNGK